MLLPVYCAVKGGFHVFSIGQRKQLAPIGIRVIESIPLMIESELNMDGREKRNMVLFDEFVSWVSVKRI